MLARSDVRMVSCTVCRKGEGKGKGGSFSTALVTTAGSQVIRPSFVLERVEKQRDREGRETAKVGMTAKVGQSERDGQTVEVGTLQAKVGSNRSQQE